MVSLDRNWIGPKRRYRLRVRVRVRRHQGTVLFLTFADFINQPGGMASCHVLTPPRSALNKVINGFWQLDSQDTADQSDHVLANSSLQLSPDGGRRFKIRMEPGQGWIALDSSVKVTDVA
jgi:hypothetical protein